MTASPGSHVVNCCDNVCKSTILITVIITNEYLNFWSDPEHG